jgi:hypothetical protein
LIEEEKKNRKNTVDISLNLNIIHVTKQVNRKYWSGRNYLEKGKEVNMGKYNFFDGPDDDDEEATFPEDYDS